MTRGWLKIRLQCRLPARSSKIRKLRGQLWTGRSFRCQLTLKSTHLCILPLCSSCLVDRRNSALLLLPSCRCLNKCWTTYKTHIQVIRSLFTSRLSWFPEQPKQKSPIGILRLMRIYRSDWPHTSAYLIGCFWLATQTVRDPERNS